MKSMSARDAKNAFGLLLDMARAEPVTVQKHGRPVVVVLSIEEYERIKVPPRKAPKKEAEPNERVMATRNDRSSETQQIRHHTPKLP